MKTRKANMAHQSCEPCLYDSELDFVVDLHVAFGRHHLTEVEEHARFPLHAANEPEAVLDAADEALLAHLAVDEERLADQLDVGGSLQLVAPVGGNVEVDQVVYLQRVVALLVFVSIWNFNRPTNIIFITKELF